MGREAQQCTLCVHQKKMHILTKKKMHIVDYYFVRDILNSSNFDPTKTTEGKARGQFRGTFNSTQLQSVWQKKKKLQSLNSSSSWSWHWHGSLYSWCFSLVPRLQGTSESFLLCCAMLEWHPSRRNRRRPKGGARSWRSANRWAWSLLSPEPVRPIGGTLSGTKIPLPQVSSPLSSFHLPSNFQTFLWFVHDVVVVREGNPFHASHSVLLSLHV